MEEGLTVWTTGQPSHNQFTWVLTIVAIVIIELIMISFQVRVIIGWVWSPMKISRHGLHEMGVAR